MFTRRRLCRSIVAGAALAALAGPSAFAAFDASDYPPNVFFSPCGKPFRAPINQPYPVGDWFKAADKNGDGQLDRDEFTADAEAFFNALDVNGDGRLDNTEIRRYEHEIAPEVLGLRFIARNDRARLWLAQLDTTPGIIDPSGQQPGDARRKQQELDESGQGASPYGFFEEPEPVMAADENLNGIIKKAAFLRLAGRHFDRLDPDGVGYLTLAKLPKTSMQVRVERAQRGLKRS
jgi:hypothetical protein